MNDAEKYKLYASLDLHSRRVESAREKIHAALALADNWCVSYSGGKDSTALLGLLTEEGWRGDMVQFRYSDFETPPENIELGAKYAAKYGLKHIVVDAYSCREAWDTIGRFYCIPTSPEEKKLARLADKDFRDKSEALIKANGYGGLFWGLRKKESKARNLALSVWGDTYKAKCRSCYTCAPLAQWTGDDVWGYIFSHGLTYLAVYDNPLVPRDEIRNELNYMCTKKGVFNGIFEKYRLLYPEIIMALQAKYGVVMK